MRFWRVDWWSETLLPRTGARCSSHDGIAGRALDGDVESGFLGGEFGVLPELANLGFEGGVGGLVEGDAGADSVEVDAAEGAMENDAVVLDFPNACALFEVAVFSGVEDDAVAGFEGWVLFGRRNVETDPAVLGFGDGSEKGAALFPEATVGEVGVVSAGEPTGGEAARECHLKGVAVGVGDGTRGMTVPVMNPSGRKLLNISSQGSWVLQNIGHLIRVVLRVTNEMIVGLILPEVSISI